MLQLKKVTIQGLRNGTQLNIFDCRGIPLEDLPRKLFEADLNEVINGSIKKDYEVMYIFSESECFSYFILLDEYPRQRG